jgi:methylmalonyl-CoA mutase N-terminal domain/subunit
LPARPPARSRRSALQMRKAIESGMPKMRIEESAARKQARVDSGRDVVVGVNKYVLKEQDPLDVLSIDNTEVRAKQIARIQKVKRERVRWRCPLPPRRFEGRTRRGLG